MPKAILTINSCNYGAWSMRSWLLCRMSSLEFTERIVSIEDASSRAELLQLSPSFLVPSLEIGNVKIWDTLAIAEYLNETQPTSPLLPEGPPARAHCRSVSAELHGGFHNLRSALPMNIKRRHSGFKLWSGVEPDIERVTEIWRECLQGYGGPWLFGVRPTMADAMYAPECTRFRTYEVTLHGACEQYIDTMLGCPEVQEWVEKAMAEPETLMDLEGDF
jgi:glutathione S-transferase